MNRKILPPSYFFALLVASLVAHFVFPHNEVIKSPLKYGGVLLIIFGIVLNIWADNLFKKSKTTVKPHEKPSHLITTGPFKISRHPMYIGMITILLGTSVLLGSLVTVIFPIIFLILMEILFIPMEEQNLGQVFGKLYFDYKKRVRRWI
ncbi:methyltransferase family protein [Candidatus Latescibacterota bacterium]